MKKKNSNLNNCLNSVANAMSFILLLTAAIALIWIIVCSILKCCDIIKYDSTCILFDLKAQITFFGGCLSLWLVCFQLKKQSDIETVKLLGYLRELLNTGEKKKIHFYLFDSKNRQAKSEFDNQFKYRIVNVYNSDLRKHIEKEKGYYKYLIKHFEKLGTN